MAGDHKDDERETSQSFSFTLPDVLPDVFHILNITYGLPFKAASSLRQVQSHLLSVMRTAKHSDFTYNNYVINYNNNFKLRSI